MKIDLTNKTKCGLIKLQTESENPFTVLDGSVEIMSTSDFAKQYSSPEEVKQASKEIMIKFDKVLKNLAKR